MQEFIAKQDCVITGHAGIVRAGDRISLSPRAAKYPRLKGWIASAPKKPAADASAGQAQEPKKPTARRRRQSRKS